MDQFVRRNENATHQRNDAFRRANENDTITLPSPEGREDCPTCGQPINGRKMGAMDWVRLPAGVRFDPSDEELLRHLAAKVGHGSDVSHPLIDDFISHLDGDDGICQTHPENLPGVKTDGSSRHFFHKPAKAYTTGTRKRRKIHNEDDESGVETRWHKTGRTRPVTDGGQQLGWKKIMVLYRNSFSGKKKAKSEKTNWILHQYHLGPDEEERDGELVVCKVFYQKQPRQCTGGRQAEPGIADGDNSKPETSQVHPQVGRELSVACVSDASRGSLITPKRDAPQRPQFSPHRSREVSPPLQAHLEPLAIRTPAQSGRGSDMTVMGKPELPASEMTSSLGVPLGRTQSMTPCLNAGSLQSIGRVHSVPLEPLRENGSPDWNEEVSTPGKSCQNDNALIAVEDHSRDDEYYTQPYLPCQSQPPETDQELLELSDLHCTEELAGTPLFYDWGMPSFQYEGPEDGHAFGDIFNPNPEYPYFEGILLSTPPSILSDMKLSSQEVEMWNLKHCEYDPNDNSDSLSST